MVPICGFNGCNQLIKMNLPRHMFTHYKEDFLKKYKSEIEKCLAFSKCPDSNCSFNPLGSRRFYELSRHYFCRHVYEEFVQNSSSSDQGKTVSEKEESSIDEDEKFEELLRSADIQMNRRPKRKLNVLDTSSVADFDIQPNSKKVEFQNTQCTPPKLVVKKTNTKYDSSSDDGEESSKLFDSIDNMEILNLNDDEARPEETIIMNVSCKSTKAVMYVAKYESGGKGKCILLNGEWLTPNVFEKKAGSKARNHKMSIKYDGKPIRDFLTTSDQINVNRIRILKTKKANHNNEKVAKDEVAVSKVSVTDKTLPEYESDEYISEKVVTDLIQRSDNILDNIKKFKNEQIESVLDDTGSLHDNSNDSAEIPIENEREIKSEIDKDSENDQANQVKTCRLCKPNKRIKYSQENEELWFHHLFNSHFKAKFQSVLDKNSQDPKRCPVCRLTINNSKSEELKNHFISFHGMDFAEEFYENEINIQNAKSKPKPAQPTDTETDDIELVAVVEKKANQHRAVG